MQVQHQPACLQKISKNIFCNNSVQCLQMYQPLIKPQTTTHYHCKYTFHLLDGICSTSLFSTMCAPSMSSNTYHHIEQACQFNCSLTMFACPIARSMPLHKRRLRTIGTTFHYSLGENSIELQKDVQTNKPVNFTGA